MMKVRNTRSCRPAFAGGWASSARGYSLVELMVAIAVLTVVLGAMMQFMSMLQQRYTRQQRVSGISQTGKSAAELLAVDIGQAGYYPGRNTTAPAAINTLGLLDVQLDSAAGIYPGSVIMLDLGRKQEAVALTAVNHTNNTVTGSVKLTHTTTPIAVRLSEAPYPEGILAPVLKDASNNFVVNTAGSNATTLKLMGDLRGDGNLRYIEYRYRSETSSATACATPPCALWRSDSCIPGTNVACTITNQETAVLAADSIMNDPAVGVFRYAVMCRSGTGTLPTLSYVTYQNTSMTPGVDSTATPGSTSPCPSTSQFYVVGVQVNLTLRTPQPVEGPGGGPTTITMRQTHVPRNILFALRLALDSLQELLPEKPSTVPLPE